MTTRHLEHALKPTSVAVIGASARAGAIGSVVLENIRGGGFGGPIYPVNPKYAELCGFKVFPDVAALPATPDLAVIATPPDTVAPLIAALGEKGCKAAVVLTAGFGEGGSADGEKRRQALLTAAQPHLLRVIGPNCFGLMLPGVGLNASFARTGAISGRLALISQSGAVVAAMLDWAKPRAIGFSHVVSVGDMADVDFGDLLDYLANDPGTEAILLYVEAITHARKFMSAARAAARSKPVLVVKGGRHAAGARAASSHTGALAGSDAVYSAAFARAGVLRVDGIEDLFAAAELLTTVSPPHGDRLAIVTNGGGFGVLASDVLAAEGGRLAELTASTMDKLNGQLPPAWSHGNPVDVIGDADGPRYAGAVAHVLADPGVDAVLAVLCPTAVGDPLNVAQAVAGAAAPSRKPVFTAWLGEASVGFARAHFIEKHIPTFDSITAAVRAFLTAARHRKHQAMLLETPPPNTAIPPQNAAAGRNIVTACSAGWMSPVEVKQLLQLYGIPCNRTAFVETPEAAADLALSWNIPVALKIVSPDIVHKSDVGGVALDLNGAGAVREAAAVMLDTIRTRLPRARISGFILEEMVHRPKAQELLLGVIQDATFGPVIAFGHGGTAVEVINDKSLALPPLNLNLAHAMIAETRVGKMLRGYRSTPQAKLEQIAQALTSLSQLIIDNPEIAELDVNPLLADENGIIALDGRIKVDASESRPIVISPYPQHLAKDLVLPSGQKVFIRPIRPEDEPLLQRFISKLDACDARYRFFAPVRELSHTIAARLTQIDYDREMAIAAFPSSERVEDLWGVVRFYADPDNRRAEFAIVIQSSQRGRGLGRALMNYIIEFARGRGVETLWGDVLIENTRMLNMCDRLAMRRGESPLGAGVTRVTLNLQSRTASPGQSL